MEKKNTKPVAPMTMPISSLAGEKTKTKNKNSIGSISRKENDVMKDLKMVTATTVLPHKKANLQMSEQVEENVPSSSIVRNQRIPTSSGNDDDDELLPNSASG